MLWKPPSVKYAVHDGDTYWFIVDIKNNSFREGAFVCDVRLFGYSAREIGQPGETETTGEIIRVSGRQAREIAEEVLRLADQIELEFMGRDKYGRDLANVYVNGDLLGPLLVARNAVVAGSFKGLHGPEFAIYDQQP